MTPEEAAASSLSRIDAERAAEAAPQQEPRDCEHDERDRPAQVVEPLVERRDLDPEHLDRDRRLLEGDRIGDRLDLRPSVEGEQLIPPPPPVNSSNFFTTAGAATAIAERREREVEARQPQRREAEEEADDAGDEAGDRDRPDVAHVARELVAQELERRLLVRHQDRRRVAADQHEGAVAERDLPRDAGQQVEPEQRDEVDADVRELLRPEVADDARQEEDRHRQRAGRRRTLIRSARFTRAS